MIWYKNQYTETNISDYIPTLMHIHEAKFVTSVANLTTLPAPSLPEFAVIWRSNVGKSTLINMLTQRTWLAKSSSTPGKTQLINIFSVNNMFILIDLPGYGYAKANINDRNMWMDRTREYITTREKLQHVFVLIDGSIPPQQIDIDFIQDIRKASIPYSIIITKTDKSPQKIVDRHITLLKQSLQKIIPAIPQIFLSSSKKNRGRDQIVNHIASLL